MDSMKIEYPRYKSGEIPAIEKTLSRAEKDKLDEFCKKCSITAGQKKVDKIRKLLLQLRDVTETSLLSQTKQSLDSFLVVLNKCDKSYWTKDELKIYIKQFVLWNYKNAEMVENFKMQAKKGLNPQKITESNLLTEEDVEKMLRYAQSFKEKAYLLLAFQTGARPQELLNLRWKDVKFS